MIENDLFLRFVRVRGEISNLSLSGGHYYFTLKDREAAVSAVMFRSNASRLKFRPENGMKVIAGGSATVYAPQGKYQLCLTSLVPDGAGELAVAFEQLRKRLDAEGLFRQEIKRPIPRFPKKIGVITSPTGAAVRDIINVTKRRFPYAELLIFPSLVQGDGAEADLIEGIKYLGSPVKRADVIIIGRGGGSIEDLWAFNSEQLAREIRKSHVPVISAVGHETDFTICDFASDLRAPTPSAAAEIATPSAEEILSYLRGAKEKMYSDLENLLTRYRRELIMCSESRVLSSPSVYVNERRALLDGQKEQLVSFVNAKLRSLRSDLSESTAVLEAISPLKTISKGYAVMLGGDGKPIRSIKKIKENDVLDIILSDGEVRAAAKEISEKNRFEKK